MQSLIIIIVNLIIYGQNEVFPFFIVELSSGLLPYGFNKLINNFVPELNKKGLYMNLVMIIHSTLI